MGCRPRRLWLEGTAVVLLAVSVACATARMPRAAKAYRADVVVTLEGPGDEPVSIEISERFHDGKRRRSATIDGERIVAIDRPDLRVTWILHPATRTFDEVSIRNDEAGIPTVPDPFRPRSDLAFAFVGEDRLEGVDVRRFDVAGATTKGVAWFTHDRIPVLFRGTMEIAGTTHTIEARYTGIEIGVQPAYLFAIPPNYPGFAERTKPRERPRYPDPTDINEARSQVEDQLMIEGPGM